MHIESGILGTCFCTATIQICRVKSGEVVVTAGKGETNILFELNNIDCLHLASIFKKYGEGRDGQ